MGDTAVSLLAEARAAGLEVRLEAERLVVRGPRSRKALAERLLARKGEVLTALAGEDEAVAWRAAAMRPQVPGTGPIPFLIAREEAPAPGRCLSCGDPLGRDRGHRCGPCIRAAWLVLHEVREGVGG